MKWISVKDRLPDNDRIIFLKTDSILGIKYKVGSYENGKFYAVGGLYDNVTDWCECEDEE